MGAQVGEQDPLWMAACVAVGALWLLAISWKAESGSASVVTRGLLGGLAAIGVAFGLYRLVELAGIELSWDRVALGSWPAFGLAGLIGLVEEGAKLCGIVLATPRARGPRSRGGSREARVLRATLAVAAVFAVAEAAIALRDATWGVALGRAVLGPVAHGLLAAPFAVTLAELPGRPRPWLAIRLALAVALAALLHGLGDFCVARAGWGRAGFALALLLPALWLFGRERLRWTAPTPFRQMGGRLFSP